MDKRGKKRIGLFSMRDERVLNYCSSLIEDLSEIGVEVVLEERTAEAIGMEGKPMSEMEVDLLLVLGGDGTILRAHRELDGREIPVLGVNFGKMGFLAEVGPEELMDSLEKFLSGDTWVDRRSKVKTQVEGKRFPDALNEVVLITEKPAKIMKFSLEIGGEYFCEFYGDGIIVSSPTGSTAYSLSAGGPLVDPRSRGLVITPISPFKPILRPMFVPEEIEVVIRPKLKRKRALLVIDGIEEGKIEEGEESRVSVSEKEAYFLRTGRSFYKKVREMLLK